MINKNNLLVANICNPNDSHEVLAGVHVTEEYTEATDSYCLMRVEQLDIPISEFPEVNGKPIETKEMVVDVEAVKNLKFFKENKKLPVLNNVIVSNETESEIELTTTNLKTNNTVKAKKLEGNYPQTSQVIGEMKNQREFNVKLLKKVIDTVDKMGIRIAEIDIAGEQIIVEGKTPQNQKVKAVLMLIHK